MTRALCHHCGLPVGALNYRGQEHPFCCYGCYLAWRIVGEQGQAGPFSGILARLGIAGVLAMNVMMVSLLLYSDSLAGIGSEAIRVFRWVLLGLSLPVLAMLSPPFLRGAVRDLRQGQPRMDTLIAVGALASFGVSAAHVIENRGYIYFDTAAMLLVLVTVGRLLEASARVEASRALQELVQLKPPMARLIGQGGDQEIPVEQVRVGDRVRVRPGELVPADGVIRAGASSVHEAALTGEFHPRPCQPGDRVFGGSANGEGEIILEATAVGEGTLLDQIARLVREAQARRAPAERLADRAASVFVPLVFLIASGALGYWLWQGDAAKGGMSALAVLVVACPCALGLATPLAICVAIARAAREGVLVRAGEALEKLSRVSTVIFDKTGTLSEGLPTLREIACCPAAACRQDEALAWLASLEGASEHIVARSIVSAATNRGLALGTTEGFRAFPGQGAQGRVVMNGTPRELWAGTPAFLEQHGIDISCAEALSDPEPADTLVFVAWEGRARARARLSDSPRPEAAQAVRELQQQRLAVMMLSGDRQSAAGHFGRAIGIAEVKAERNPAEKIAEVRAQKERGRVVAVVGDGINDAPALAEADVGIAMGGGTDLAREVGDVTLLRDRLLLIPWSLKLARSTYRVIRQNLLWAFGYNLAAIGLAFFGYLHPLIAALAMLGSSLFVIRNSLGLARQPGGSPELRPQEA